MGGAFPELHAQRTLVERVIREEEQSFFRTLENGLRLMDTIMTKANAAKQKVLEGTVVL